jgi:hypothetical protein
MIIVAVQACRSLYSASDIESEALNHEGLALVLPSLSILELSGVDPPKRSLNLDYTRSPERIVCRLFLSLASLNMGRSFETIHTL